MVRAVNFQNLSLAFFLKLGSYFASVFLVLPICGVTFSAEKKSDGLPWAFTPVVKPVRPAVKDSRWSRDEMDDFILSRLESRGISPNSDAPSELLLRRIYFDLTGLPPTPAEVRDWEKLGNNRTPADVASLVDRLLASPRFGERWARHWLDVVRYADSVGRNWNAPYNYAWRYRDWVIDSLNKDKPYDRFLTEQLAGDLLPWNTVDERREQLTGTGFLALGSLDLQALDGEQFTLDRVDDQIDVVSRSMLALTISCARCHDHKYDPVTMRDYYALAGIFYSTRTHSGTPYRGRGNGYVDHEDLVLLPVSEKGKSVTPAIVPGVHSMSDYQAVWSSGKREIRFTTDPNLVMGAGEDDVVDCALRIKGDPHDRGPAPPRGDVRIVGLPQILSPGRSASGRLELARWVSSPQNPLTARVMANRVWHHLIGQPLVSTPDDFGATSEPPSHPELLDHLATRFVAEKWSLRKLVRIIVLSRTYQISSSTRTNNAREIDPQNVLCWRANLKRLEFEPLRDSLLEAAGNLTFDRPYGIQVAGIGGKSQKSQVRGLIDVDSSYRTVYLPVVRGRLPETYGTFDFPDPCQIAGKRDVTTVAPQALFFLNGRLVSDSAELTARYAQSKFPDETERIGWISRQLFGRSPTAAEIDESRRFLKEIDPNGKDVGTRWAALVQGWMASAEFRYLR